MPTLEWIGKEKVVNHHHDVPYRVLERQYSFDEKGEHAADNGSENMIIHGDNLEALKALLPRYEGKVDCIYIDPPYNTGNEGWIYNDNVNDPKIRKWLGEVVGKEGEDFTRHDKWLCMMYPRLQLLKRLLSPNGTFFVSIGDDELANLLHIIKEIFGNIDALFVWISRTKPTNAGIAKYRPQRVAEYVLMYTVNPNQKFNLQEKDIEYSYPNHDEHGNFRTQTILTSNYGSYKRETMRFEVAGYTPPEDKRWKGGYALVNNLLLNHRLMFTKDGTPMEKIYDYDESTIEMPLYTAIRETISGTAENGKNELNEILGMGHGFDTVKPTKLLMYLIHAATKPESIILDSFAGSGTTAHAVLKANQADGGKRRFILVEMGDYAESITVERVKRVIRGYGEGKKAVTGTGGSFSYYELGAELMTREGQLNEAVGEERIREYIWHTETRTKPLTRRNGNRYYLGTHLRTAYYFYYAPERATTLNHDFLATIPEREETTVIYADKCAIGEQELMKLGIIFKKIPRDITKL